MKKIINLLYDVEAKANHILDTVADEKTNLKLKFEAEEKRFDEQVAKDNNVKLEALKSSMEKDFNERKKEIQNNCQKQLSDMDKKYENDRESLVEQIFLDMISI